MENNNYKKVTGTVFLQFRAFCLLLLLSVAMINPAKALVSSYTFTASNGPYIPITGATLFSGTWDDDSASVTLPFSFIYDNISYNRVSISSNGFVTFSTIPNVYFVCGLQTSPVKTIAAYGTDLQAATGASTVQYSVVGVAPNRQFIVQWADVDHYSTVGHNTHWNFQLILNETSNTIQVVWGATTIGRTMGANSCSDAITESGDIGLMGSNTSDLNIRKIANGTDTWSASSVGTLLTDVCEMSATNFPPPGLIYTWTPEAAVPMDYTSSTTLYLNNLQEVGQGTPDNPIIQVQVVTTGILSPFNLTSLHLTTSGSTNAGADLLNAKVYYTGFSSVFSTSTQFGSTVASPNGAYTVNGSVVLTQGTNYFWITYDITPGASLGDTVSGCCTQAIGSGVMGTQVPTLTCPGGIQTIAEIGVWTPVNALAPDNNAGVMLLLTDGTIMCKTDAGGGDGIGNTWDKLTPDIHGSYANGTWTQLAPMHDTRLYFSSQVLKDGRVYVAGGEYGTGTGFSETYDPLTDVWTMAPTTGHNYVDANSEMLPDGSVLQACEWDNITFIYDPISNSYTPGGTPLGTVDESAWAKLPDSSILFVDMDTRNSERYIPSLNTWIADATVPVDLYDPFGSEAGGAFLLPNGQAFFLGATGHTAYYIPSGSTAPGSWVAGPDIPSGQGTPDAASAMMVNGKILCAVSPIPTSADHFPPPTAFYEFNYLTSSFTHIKTPAGDASEAGVPCYITNMLDLPDGSVLYAEQGMTQYYLYKPGGSPLAAGKPTVNNIVQTGCYTFMVTGTLFNGISEGASYGDDWQMATNYPIVRLTSGANVYYVRTSEWNSTGVQRGINADTTYFTIPSTLPNTPYSLAVVANGISSDTVTFTFSICTEIEETASLNKDISVYPNPANSNVIVDFTSKQPGVYTIRLLDVMGSTISTGTGNAASGENKHQINLESIAKGIYILELQMGDVVNKVKLVVR